MKKLHIEHGPDAVRREFDDWHKVPAHWIRMAMSGCEKCAQWKAGRARMSSMHRAYRKRR